MFGTEVRKRFDRELHRSNDEQAKRLVRFMLDNTEFEVKESEDPYSVDLRIFYAGVHIANIECEIKRVWQGKFPYDSLQIPYRKAKYCGLGQITFFIIFDNEGKQYMLVDSETMQDSPVAVVHNKYVENGEKFFQVPVKKLKHFGLVETLRLLVKKVLVGESANGQSEVFGSSV